jgi:diguanylate cyclase (GGDEF)-like protein
MFEKLQLKEKAIRDQLTNAYNITYFESSIQSILSNNEKQNGKTGIIIFDIDYFKNINDNYGHGVGDLVLKTLVEVINNFIRKDDKLIRWGGEEFVILLYAKSLEDVKIQAEHLKVVIQNHKFNQIQIPSLTCSFGITLHESETSIEESIKKADEKLYLAKKNGRNRVEY